MTSPDPMHLHAVEEFLDKHSVKHRRVTANGDFIVADVPVRTAEEMLSAKYVQLAHKEAGLKVHRAPGGYSLPTEVAAAVDFVAPTVHVPGVQKPKTSSEAPSFRWWPQHAKESASALQR